MLCDEHLHQALDRVFELGDAQTLNCLATPITPISSASIIVSSMSPSILDCLTTISFFLHPIAISQVEGISGRHLDSHLQQVPQE